MKSLFSKKLVYALSGLGLMVGVMAGAGVSADSGRGHHGDGHKFDRKDDFRFEKRIRHDDDDFRFEKRFRRDGKEFRFEKRFDGDRFEVRFRGDRD